MGASQEVSARNTTATVESYSSSLTWQAFSTNAHTCGVHTRALHVRVQQVRQIAAHQSAIHDISFDASADNLATCADDGSVLVSIGLQTAFSHNTLSVPLTLRHFGLPLTPSPFWC